MEHVFSLMEGIMIPLAKKISNNRYLLAIRDAFFILMELSSKVCKLF